MQGSHLALELFVEQLLRKSVEFTLSRNAKTLSPAHLKQCILAENRFDFLKDLVMSIPDVQGDGDDSSSVPGTPVVSAQPPIFRSQSSSDATTSGRRAVGASSRPRGRPRKNHSLPQPASSAKSASDEESDSDLDDEEEEEDDESEPQPKVHKKLNSANGSSSTSLKAAVPMQFNAAQPNFYQEINSVQFQINIPPNNGAPADKTKSNDDDDYDT
nr:EOG090X0H1B [Eulimnadia texana]